MTKFPCPNCYDEPLPPDEVPCWKCGSRRQRQESREDASAREMQAEIQALRHRVAELEADLEHALSSESAADWHRRLLALQDWLTCHKEARA